MDLQEINGYTVVGRISGPDGDLIMGETYKGTADGAQDFRLVFVVAFVPLESAEWINGRYFDGPRGRDNRAGARDHFLKRAVDLLT